MPITPYRMQFDGTSLITGSQRSLCISGEMHYARIDPQRWPYLLDQAKACGLTTIASYVFWGLHEPEPGRFSFDGAGDVGRFVDLCAERDLNVFLRLGPYCCAEWNYGGFPAWLRDVPGVVMRTWNEPYLAVVERYYRHLAAELVPRQSTLGGGLALVQVENEYNNIARRYGAEGGRYIAWIVELAQRLGFQVPIVTCEGGTPGAIEGLNGFSISDERIRQHRQDHASSPLMWTELWTGWYDTWGHARHLRDGASIAYHLLRFIGQGGTGWNYYMWHGGTNFGRSAMWSQTTSYGFDAPVDEYGLLTPKGVGLARLHADLEPWHQLLLTGRRCRVGRSGGSTTTWTGEGRVLTLEIDDVLRRAVLRDGACVIHDSSATVPDGPVVSADWEPAATASLSRSWSEPLPAEREDAPIEADAPVEQLLLTADRSDYCWYACDITVGGDGGHELVLPWCGDVLTVFLDQACVGTTPGPCPEIRGPTRPAGADGQGVNQLESSATDGYLQRFRFQAAPGRHRLSILAAAVGLIKGDWMVSGPMTAERKGIWGPVLLDGSAIGPWRMHPCLIGERDGLAAGHAPGLWTTAALPRAPAWHEADFAIPAERLSGGWVFRLDAGSLGKGMIFVNGRCLGRHWLIAATGGWGCDGSWHDAAAHGLSITGQDLPTQRWYHVPSAWLAPSTRLTVFDERPLQAAELRLECRRQPPMG